MSLYRCRIYTGPVGVDQWARRLKAAKLKRVTAGTEHVYAEIRATDQGAAENSVIRAVRQKTGQAFKVVDRVVCNRRPTR